jgi:enoyl-CoA hydratase
MLHVVQHNGLRTLTLARPERGNALCAELVEALIAQVHAACIDADTHTLLLRAEGRHFCTGLDLSDLDVCSDGDLLLRLVRIETLLSLLWQAPVRTVALAQGRAWGAGADLFVACEQRLCTPGTSFRFPGALFGIVLGTRRLAQRVGRDRVRGIVIEGHELDAETAQHIGLASAITVAQAALELVPPQVNRATAAAIRAATQTGRSSAASGHASEWPAAAAVDSDGDLAALVRSAAEPGLKARIVAYRAALRRPA